MKKIIALISALALSFGLVACGDSGSQSQADETTTASATESTTDNTSAEKKYNIGFIPMTLNNEYFITMVNGAKIEAEELGVELSVQAGDQHASASEQLTIVENMITSGVDAICIVPSSSEGLYAALTKCKEANIPVINIDTKLDDEILVQANMEVPFFGTNNYEGAKSAGEYVKENFAAGTKTAILTGIEGQQNASDRRDGFVEGAGDAITIVAEQSANWEVDQGYAAAQNIITANPDVELFYCGNDGMAIGAVRAIQEAKLQDQIKVIGFDGVSEALEMISNGSMFGSVAQYPGEMGILGVKNAVAVLNGEEIEQYINTGAKLITPENVQEHKDYIKKFE